VQLGVTATGLIVFQNNARVNTFSWLELIEDICKIGISLMLYTWRILDLVHPDSGGSASRSVNTGTKNSVLSCISLLNYSLYWLQ